MTLVDELSGRDVLVVGLGVSGFAATNALVRLGARVRVTEQTDSLEIRERAETLRSAGAEVEIGGHSSSPEASLVVVSPGVPPSAAVVEAARRDGIPVWSEIELASRLASCDFLAVTGTNGKTTTTTLLAAILAEGGIPSIAGGNIGLPLVDAVARIPPEGAIAVEVSSFQLHSIVTFRPRVAILLNVAEDHTDWHGSFESYAAAKARVVENQTTDDVFLPNLHDEAAMRIAGPARARVVPFSASVCPPRGIGIRAGSIVWRGEEVMACADSPLASGAGLEDVVAAAGAALEYGVEMRAVARAVKGFRPLAHRLQLVATIDGVDYIDDSKATNPHATLGAVRGLSNVVLIAGGRSKGIDLSTLAQTVPPVVAVVAMGEATDEIARIFHGKVPVDQVEGMDQAVAAARGRVRAGGSVLLSPACASLDMYESYAARGDDFARCVAGLANELEIDHGNH